MKKALTALAALALFSIAAPITSANASVIGSESAFFKALKTPQALSMPMTMGMLSASTKNLKVSYIGTNILTASTTTQTFTSINIGTPSSDRTVVVAFSTGITTTLGTFVNGVTINGTPMYLDKSSGSSFVKYTCIGVAHLLVPTGTTATIVITSNNNTPDCLCNVYSITGATAIVPLSVDIVSTLSGAANVDVTDKTVTIGAWAGTSVTTLVSSGWQSDTGLQTISGIHKGGSAYYQSNANETGRAFTLIGSNGTEQLMNAVTFAPVINSDCTITFCGEIGESNDSTTYTYAAQYVGAPTDDRVIAIMVNAESAAGVTPTSVTVGSASLNLIVSTTGTSSMSCWIGRVTSTDAGSLGNLTITWPSTVLRMGVGIWAVYNAIAPRAVNNTSSGATNAPLQTSFFSTASPGAISSLHTYVGGVCIAGSQTSAASTVTWSGTVGVIEDYDANNVETHGHSGASVVTTTEITSGTVTSTFVTGTTPKTIAVILR